MMRVLVAIEPGPAAEAVVLATSHLVGAADEVHLLTVIQREALRVKGSHRRAVPAEGPTGSAVDRAHHLHWLTALGARLLGDRAYWTAHVRFEDDVTETILDVADEVQAHGIAVGSSRGGPARALAGCITDALLRESPVPVLVIRQGMQVPERPARAPSVLRA
jgi:nucleotide-binding universal stress UspA family protein